MELTDAPPRERWAVDELQGLEGRFHETDRRGGCRFRDSVPGAWQASGDAGGAPGSVCAFQLSCIPRPMHAVGMADLQEKWKNGRHHEDRS